MIARKCVKQSSQNFLILRSCGGLNDCPHFPPNSSMDHATMAKKGGYRFFFFENEKMNGTSCFASELCHSNENEQFLFLMHVSKTIDCPDMKARNNRFGPTWRPSCHEWHGGPGEGLKETGLQREGLVGQLQVSGEEEGQLLWYLEGMFYGTPGTLYWYKSLRSGRGQSGRLPPQTAGRWTMASRAMWRGRPAWPPPKCWRPEVLQGHCLGGHDWGLRVQVLLRLQAKYWGHGGPRQWSFWTLKVRTGMKNFH